MKCNNFFSGRPRQSPPPLPDSLPSSEPRRLSWVWYWAVFSAWQWSWDRCWTPHRSPRSVCGRSESRPRDPPQWNPNRTQACLRLEKLNNCYVIFVNKCRKKCFDSIRIRQKLVIFFCAGFRDFSYWTPHYSYTDNATGNHIWKLSSILSHLWSINKKM